MRHMGYGLLLEGKPHGIWPSSQSHIVDRYKKLTAAHSRGKYQVVSVYMDAVGAELLSKDGEKKSS